MKLNVLEKTKVGAGELAQFVKVSAGGESLGPELDNQHSQKSWVQRASATPALRVGAEKNRFVELPDQSDRELQVAKRPRKSKFWCRHISVSSRSGIHSETLPQILFFTKRGRATD